MCFEERRGYGVGTWLSEGLELFIERWKLLMAGLLILIAISWVVDFITGVDPTLMFMVRVNVTDPSGSTTILPFGHSQSWWQPFLSLFYYFLIFPVLSAGYYLLVLQAARKEEAGLGTLWAPFSRILSVLGAVLLYFLVVLVGFLLLVIPGIIWAIKYMYAPLVVVDQGLPAAEALGESGRITAGYKWKLFLMALVFYLVIGLPVALILQVIAGASLFTGAVLAVVANLCLYPWYTAAFVVAYRDLVEEAGSGVPAPTPGA
jgi:hypothetical protein